MTLIKVKVFAEIALKFSTVTTVRAEALTLLARVAQAEVILFNSGRLRQESGVVPGSCCNQPRVANSALRTRSSAYI
jgi:hypothetical protein